MPKLKRKLTADERREWRIRLHLKCCQSEEEEVVEFLSNLAHVTEARSSQKARTSRRAAQREVDISKEVIAMCIKGRRLFESKACVFTLESFIRSKTQLQDDVDDKLNTIARVVASARYLPARKRMDTHEIILDKIVAVKAPNYVKKTDGGKKQKGFQENLCTLTATIFVAQSALRRNDRGLYNLLTRNASGHSQTMFEAMEAHKGYCWEAEVARAKLVIEKKEEFDQAALKRRSIEFWVEETIKIHTLRGHYSVCTVCFHCENVQEAPNPNIEDLQYILGKKKKYCLRMCHGECKSRTRHVHIYEFEGFGFLVKNHRNKTFGHKTMDLAVKDFPASMKLDGVTFYRRSYIMIEIFNLQEAHAFVVEEVDGKLQKISDDRTDVWSIDQPHEAGVDSYAGFEVQYTSYSSLEA